MSVLLVPPQMALHRKVICRLVRADGALESLLVLGLVVLGHGGAVGEGDLTTLLSVTNVIN
jgi:hypothetical protein